jgi:hypothetical protein
MHKIFVIFLLLVLAQTAPVFADHEGPYVIGEVKDMSGVAGCLAKDDAIAIFKNLPDVKALALEFDRLRFERKCAFFNGNGRVLGQIHSDVPDNNGVPWRIIHIQYFVNAAPFEAYLITWGTESIVVKKELIQ